MVAPAKERLARAVASGRITQARADAVLEKLEALAARLAAKTRSADSTRHRRRGHRGQVPFVARGPRNKRDLTPGYTADSESRPAAARSASALSVRSHVKSRSSRPKCPYAAVFA